jgi:predicted MFS family arabinose efflux permease
MLKRYQPWLALALLTGLNLLNYVDRSVLNGVQLRVQEEFHVSHEKIGLLTTAFFWCYMACAPVMGPLADRYSRKRIIAVGGILWSAATLLTAFTHDFGTLLVRHTLVGVGEASFSTIAPTLVVDMFPEEKRGRILGFFYLAIPVGTALGYLLAGWLEPLYGWRRPFYVAGIPGLLLSLVVLTLREPERGAQDSIQETPDRGTYLGLLKNPAYWTANLCMTAMTFALGAVVVWMPTFLSTVRGMTLADANKNFGLIAAADGIVAALLGGWLGDYLLRRTHTAYYLVTAVSLGLGVPAMFYALHAHGRGLLPALAIAAFLLLLNTSPLNTAIINSVGAHVRATALALNIFIIHLLGDAFSPWLVGRIADRSSLTAGMMILPIAIAVASGFAFLGMRYAPRRPVTPALGPAHQS